MTVIVPPAEEVPDAELLFHLSVAPDPPNGFVVLHAVLKSSQYEVSDPVSVAHDPWVPSW